MTPTVFQFPKEDQATGLLLLKSWEQLIDQGLWHTGAIVGTLWHAVFEGQWTKLPDGRDYYALSGQPKVSNATLIWLANTTQREFLATVLAYMDEPTQAKVLSRWKQAPQEKLELLAGFRRWQEELKGVWQKLQSEGWVPTTLTLLRGAA